MYEGGVKMTWICARKITEEDIERLNDRAEAFIQRHDLAEDMSEYTFLSGTLDIWGRLEEYLDMMVGTSYWAHEWKYLRRLWQQVFARTTNCPGCIGVGYGYIGYPSKE